MMFDVDDEHMCSEEGLLGCSDDDDLNDDDDIYYDEVSICVSRKNITSELSARGAK